jgi:acyl carrier protein
MAQGVSEVSSSYDDVVLAVFRRHLREEDLSLDDDFSGHGGHSLIAFRMVAEFRRLFAVTPQLEDFAELSTARKMADWLQRQNAEDEDEHEEASESAQPRREMPAR